MVFAGFLLLLVFVLFFASIWQNVLVGFGWKTRDRLTTWKLPAKNPMYNLRSVETSANVMIRLKSWLEKVIFAEKIV